MTELTEAERQIIRSHRARLARKYSTWVKELREAGYTVEPPVPVSDDISPEVARPPLTETQAVLLDALRALGDGARGAQIRRDGERIARRRIPKGSAGTALRYLVIKGYAIRTGEQYTAI